MKYWKFDPEKMTQTYDFLIRPRYPVRIMPKKWPDPKLIGKAMAKGWATPCLYYPVLRGRGRYRVAFVYPGISDAEYGYILALLRQEKLL